MKATSFLLTIFFLISGNIIDAQINTPYPYDQSKKAVKTDSLKTKKKPTIADNFTLQVEVGYGFPIAGQQLGSNITNITQSEIIGSFGQSFTAGGLFGYSFCPLFTLEGEGRFQLGREVNSPYAMSNNASSITNDFKEHLNLGALSIGGRFDYPTKSRFKPFGGFGLDIDVAGKMKMMENETTVFAGSTVITIDNYHTTELPAFGAYAKAGAEYLITPHIGVFAQLRLDAISLLPDKLFLDSETQNGVNITNTLNVSEKVTDYYRSLPSNSTTNPSQPSKELAPEKYPASSYGINIGMTFRL